MKSEWKVMSQMAGGEKYYRVYRIRDTKAVMHAGNIEFYPGAELTIGKEQAQQIADRLNNEETSEEEGSL